MSNTGRAIRTQVFEVSVDDKITLAGACKLIVLNSGEADVTMNINGTGNVAVSYTHLTLPTTPYV